ncbi:hypothetical protein [Priestia megaterium]|uniref:hypothetical protein n=1 Tax=Priestia megaterium TaxID=1404 RepID=UPI003D2A0F11
MKILQEPVISSVISYFNTSTEQLLKELKSNATFYLFDNDFMSLLRKLSDSDLECIISSFDESNIILVPDVVLQESYGNDWMTPDRYKSKYQKFFETLSNHKLLFIISLDTLFEIMINDCGDETQAMNLMKKLSIEATRGHKTISDSIKKLSLPNRMTLPILQSALDFSSSNGGERFLTLANLVLINSYFGPGYIFSNDNQVYADRNIHAGNDKLRNRLDLSEEEFRDVYKTFSYVKVLTHTIQSQCFTKGQALDFLTRCRHYDRNRKIKAVIYDDWFHDLLSDEKLVDLTLERKININF